ncbi:prepilin-type N-terminal cleavage/methylation domain-containing protein [Janthinobacterium sp. PAMC25594]|uniref:prepilin-type N-terminal cleavage/methylation domain-containing protein n=1 Tax=Janthinobacterium sp. PAMC25594 TaxID=2861284 RepID=UPI001C62D32F|nr:prepilin-type N-terminal cleavage/methylation domain-containing protein [Janthinobacterium sp. PAMC25594]QYG07232.1 prepilin-type N-terminal cleavage/methylation domain-containing protein [Janthinobacterium sp. PAMC25594]
MLAGKARQRGFTLFELAVAVAVIAVLAVVLLSRLELLQQDAERVAVRQTVLALRAGLRMQVLELYASDRQNQLPALAGQNPIDWLAEKPANYLGVYMAPEMEKLPPSHWFFDRSNAELIYILNRGNTFGADRSELLQFKVSLRQASATRAQSSSPVDAPEVALIQVGEAGGLK